MGEPVERGQDVEDTVMATLEDLTVPFAGVVARRGRERAAADGQAFPLGTAGHAWGSIYRERGSRAVIGASGRALGQDDLEHAVQIIGTVGGLLATWSSRCARSAR